MADVRPFISVFCSSLQSKPIVGTQDLCKGTLASLPPRPMPIQSWRPRTSNLHSQGPCALTLRPYYRF
eukprot:7361139-Pyramimonas_sp.AAC.1